MSWLFLATLARFLWACAGSVDQLISRAHKGQKVASAIILYYIAQVPFVAFLLCMSDMQFNLSGPFLFWTSLAAIANVVALLPYLKCLQTDDAHSVMAYLELTPICLMALAFFMHGETLTMTQLSGAAIVIICGFIFSWDFRHGHFRARSLALMSVSAFLFACYQLSLRTAGEYSDAWGVSGIVLGLETILGWVAFMLHKKARHSIISTISETQGRSLYLAWGSNALSIAGITMIIAAFQAAPTTAHVAAIGPTQPFFSFFVAAVLGLILAKYYPRVPFDGETKIKLTLLVGIFGGIYLLVMG